MEPSDALHSFRHSLYECLHPRGDALFELTDAILSADAAFPSPVHLSLQASHRRGWGSLYAALWRGRIDAEALRRLLARHPLAGSQTPVYAVDVSVWPRCDAECSPERGYYYHPSRHSAGQPIVAGWAYQFIAQLNFIRESWTALVDVERLRPRRDANEVAAEQVKAFVRRSSEEGGAAPPLFVFDAGYDPVKLQQGLEGSSCQILVRLRAGRCFRADPSLAGPPAPIGRPRRHGPKMKCNDPNTWPEPSTEYICEDAGYGTVRVRAFSKLHPKVRAHQGRGSRGPLPIVVGTLILVEVERLPRGERRREPRVLWLWWHGPEGEQPKLGLLWRLRQAFRPGAHLPLFQADFGMDYAERAPPRAGGPVDVVGFGRFHPAEAGEGMRCGPQATVGASLRHRPPDADPSPSRSFGAFGAPGHARQAAETLRQVPWAAQRTTLWPSQALPGAQKECLSLRRGQKRRVLRWT